MCVCPLRVRAFVLESRTDAVTDMARYLCSHDLEGGGIAIARSCNLEVIVVVAPAKMKVTHKVRTSDRTFILDMRPSGSVLRLRQILAIDAA